MAGQVVSVFTEEVGGLLFREKNEKSTSLLRRMARIALSKVGITKRLSEQASFFHKRISDYESKIQIETIARSRLEQKAIDAKAYVVKVGQINHDIRSPLSSLQAIYEKLKADDVATTKALANAIRRIQNLADDLKQVDAASESPKLLINA